MKCRLSTSTHDENVREDVLGSELGAQRHERSRLGHLVPGFVVSTKDDLVPSRRVPAEHWNDAVFKVLVLPELDLELKSVSSRVTGELPLDL